MKKLFLCAALALLLPTHAKASCDLCAVYIAQQVNTFHPDQLTIGAAEQFSSSGRLQENGDKIADPAHQYMNSSVTQVFTRYDLTESVALQGNIPVIDRNYRRATEVGAEKGSVAGLGDISLLALFNPIHLDENGNLFRLTFTGGLKTPTGSYNRLKDELNDDNQTVVSGVHGHGLALGTGSWDAVTGTNFFARYGNWLTAGSALYTIRNVGSYGYRYGNDLMWDLGIGRYLLLEERETVALRFNLLGEVKGFDSVRGEESRDSALTSVFMGPELDFTAGSDVFGLLALDIPTVMNNTEIGVVADYRVRLSVMYRF